MTGKVPLLRSVWRQVDGEPPGLTQLRDDESSRRGRFLVAGAGTLAITPTLTTDGPKVAPLSRHMTPHAPRYQSHYRRRRAQ
jgi:hypothetical protein